MEKPRIIIADTDLNYLIPLQAKFAEEMYEQMELEVITDKSYFEQFFSVPQTAEILVVSEALYSPEIRRHNITHVFLMMEQQEMEYTSQLNINRLYKYTSIKEIFTEISGIGGESLDIHREPRKAPKLITVCSACGGTGKTTVAMGISTCLSKQYRRVLYIGADRIQSFQRLLENPAPVASTDVYAALSVSSQNAYHAVRHVIRKEGFSYLPPFKMSLLSLGLDYEIFTRIALEARASGDYDYVVVDADTAFDENKAQLLDLSDKVVIVTRQTAGSVYATNLLAGNINGLNPDKFLFVCNNYDRSQENALVNPEQSVNFIPSEYVVHMNGYDQLSCADFALDSGIQKTTVLVM